MIIVNKAKTIPEVFDKIREMESKDNKVLLLQAYETKTLKFVIDLIYNHDLTHIKIPDYVPNHRPPEICYLTLHTGMAKIKTAIQYSETKPEITERMLQVILSEISEPESDLLVSIIKGKKVEGISKSVFKEAYPDLFRFQDTSQEL
jgi:hypothetical protein